MPLRNNPPPPAPHIFLPFMTVEVFIDKSLKKNILNFSLRAASLEFQPPQVMFWCFGFWCDVVML
jgi:hypothetical protein